MKQTIAELSQLQMWLPDLQAWRRQLHSRPELGFEEHQTAAFIAEKLSSFGIEVHQGIGGTGIVGTLRRGSSSRAIGMRADMDALPIVEANTFAYRSQSPGRMHACGHDGHMVMLLAAARYLSAHGRFDGAIQFIFQPAEEGAGGAAAMLADGLFDRFPVDAVFGLHNFPELPAGTFVVRSGPVLAAFDTFDLEIRGRGTHAAFPHTGDDTVLAAGHLICAINTIVSRNIDPAQAAVLSVTRVQAGQAYNVMPAAVSIAGSIRSFRPQTRSLLLDRLAAVCHGIEATFGVRVELVSRAVYPATINTEAESNAALAVVRETFGTQALAEDFPPQLGSEDFSMMLERRPGCYVLLGNGGSSAGCALHNPSYDFNDEILVHGAAFWIRLSHAILCRTLPGQSRDRTG